VGQPLTLCRTLAGSGPEAAGEGAWQCVKPYSPGPGVWCTTIPLSILTGALNFAHTPKHATYVPSFLLVSLPLVYSVVNTRKMC
jgi:hypothetical protein